LVRERGQKVVATNRKARYDYHILDVYEAGLVLTGTEVKTLREGRASLVDGFATVDRGEVWLENVHIPEFFQGSWTNHLTRRKRKLLLNRIEIERLSRKVKESGLTLVPLSLYFKDGKAKVEIALAKGKKEYDKRASLRLRQDKHELKIRHLKSPVS
jgi:SsrA-binding protein